MATFAVTYLYGPDEDTRMAVRPTHRTWLSHLAEAGVILASGPFTGGQQPGALLVFRADSQANVEDLLANDPFAEAGVIEAVEIRQWDVVIGGFAADAER